MSQQITQIVVEHLSTHAHMSSPEGITNAAAVEPDLLAFQEAIDLLQTELLTRQDQRENEERVCLQQLQSTCNF